MDWRASAWIAPWLIGIGVISFLGQFDGRAPIPFGWDIALVALFSLVIFYLARALALPTDRVTAYVRKDEQESGMADTQPSIVVD